MNTRERFHATMDFKPVDRLPMIEWALWWDQTISRWLKEGLPADKSDRFDLYEHFGLDLYYQDWTAPLYPHAPSHGAGVAHSVEAYESLRKTIYPTRCVDLAKWERWAARQQAGDAVLWFTLLGFFWGPREILGIEQHLYAFYDSPELMNRINEDHFQFSMGVLDQICSVTTPDFVTLAEDMSYNHGSMLSKELFDQFIAPFYRRIVPELKRRGIRVFVDSDGDITEPTAWFQAVGVDGMLPLERQAGVDMEQMRKLYPDMTFIGHYDKMVMPQGEAAMRREFARLLPVASRGGFLPSVDHQTPPGVSYQEYLVYLRLYREYAEKAGAMSRCIPEKRTLS